MQTTTTYPNQKSDLHLNLPPYQLADQSTSSDTFYFVLDLFSEKMTLKGQKCFGSIIRRYRSSIAYLNTPFKLSSDENFLDILMLAVLWNEYQGSWDSSIAFKEKILNLLFRLRFKYPNQKERLDNIRGRLAQRWIVREAKPNTNISLANVKSLCNWLSATNEYNQEVNRIRSWIDFLETVPETEATRFLQELIQFGHWFKSEAKDTLKSFTYGVGPFLNQHKALYMGKENFFFTGKKEVEYHLNMVGAAIMNRSMKPEFMETEYKILLLPSCMKKNKDCQAIEIMNGTVCRHCSPDCNISKTSSEMLQQGIHTFIIQHSSGFSTYLKQWADQNKVGLIGTACTLNLLQGGFEMKRLHIPAQCIFLEYSACQKHWSKEGKPTNINLSRLKVLMDTNSNKAV